MRRSVLALLGIAPLLGSPACGARPFEAGQADAAVLPPVEGDAAAPLPPIEGDAGTRPDASPCDPRALPTEQPCVISEAAAIFVSSSLGSAGGDGSRLHPLATLGAALAAAKPLGKRVYACAETYPEAVTLRDGVSIFGNFDCAGGTWVVGTGHAIVQSPTSPAVTARAIASPTRVERIRFMAASATAPGGSSIGMVAEGSPGLTLSEVDLIAGDGAPGAAGVEGLELHLSGSANGADSLEATTCLTSECKDARRSRPGGRATCVFPNGSASAYSTLGGSGGYGGLFQKVWDNNVITSAKDQVVEAEGAGNALEPSSPLLAPPAQSGAAGTNGRTGAPGGEIGSVSSSGYTTANGLPGESGGIGQGGGGAPGSRLAARPSSTWASWPLDTVYLGAPGAGGGAGGCPGLAGTPGQGGGASIGLLLIDSPIPLLRVVVRAGKGGKGGAGTFGSAPTSGGKGGAGGTDGKTGTAGGDGGRGGLAGTSGSGGGGPSIGIAHKGGAPVLDGSDVKPGAGGAGVDALTKAGFPALAASPAGLCVATYAVP